MNPLGSEGQCPLLSAFSRSKTKRTIKRDTLILLLFGNKL